MTARKTLLVAGLALALINPAAAWSGSGVQLSVWNPKTHAWFPGPVYETAAACTEARSILTREVQMLMAMERDESGRPGYSADVIRERAHWYRCRPVEEPNDD